MKKKTCLKKDNSSYSFNLFFISFQFGQYSSINFLNSSSLTAFKNFCQPIFDKQIILEEEKQCLESLQKEIISGILSGEYDMINFNTKERK